MTDTARRALLGAIAFAPALGAVSAVAAPAVAPEWLALQARFRVAWDRYEEACALQDAADSIAWRALPFPADASLAQVDAIMEERKRTPEGRAAEAAHQEACRRGRRCAALERVAAGMPARGWPSLSIKLEILSYGAGIDELQREQLLPNGMTRWEMLISEIREVMAAG